MIRRRRLTPEHSAQVLRAVHVDMLHATYNWQICTPHTLNLSRERGAVVQLSMCQLDYLRCQFLQSFVVTGPCTF